jgi:nucleoid DNA-binding protein
MVFRLLYQYNPGFHFSLTKLTFAAADLIYNMHHLIASYLFQHKTCPLPGLGTLSVQSGNASTHFLNKTILAPQPAIVFDAKETEADALLDHIAGKANISIYEAIETLGKFANQLKMAIQSGQPAILNGVGHFSMASSGIINFEPLHVPEVFLQPVNAERVIHPEAEHAILVGDKESTNTAMTEYYSETTEVKSRWWIWAIVLGVAGIAALVLYMNGDGILSRFGNAMPIK